MKNQLGPNAPFSKFVWHAHKWECLVGLFLFLIMTAFLNAARYEGGYMYRTTIWLWVGFGLVVPGIIIYKVVQSYRDYKKGKSR